MSGAHVQRVPIVCSAELLTSVSVSLLLSRFTDSAYTWSTQSPALTGLRETKREENTRNDSEETRGCFSARDFRSTGVRIGREVVKAGEAWVEKKIERKDREVLCKAEVAVVGGCDKMDLRINVNWPVWADKEPGTTLRRALRRPNPAWRVAGGVLADLIWLRRALAKEGIWALKIVTGVSSTSIPSSRFLLPPTGESISFSGEPP